MDLDGNHDHVDNWYFQHIMGRHEGNYGALEEHHKMAEMYNIA